MKPARGPQLELGSNALFFSPVQQGQSVKWVIFAIGLVGIFPIVGWLRTNKRYLPYAWMAAGAIPFVWGVFPKREIAIMGVPDWPGYTQGFDVSLLDLLMIILYLSAPRAKPTPLPFKISFFLYIGAVLLSATQAEAPTATLYYVWQLLRIFMTYAIVARACADPRTTASLIKGLAFGLCFEAAIVAWQRFVIHYIQAPGTFEQQNMLGLATHFVIFPFFALLLAGEKEWPPITVPILGTLIYIFTASRATLAFGGTGFTILFLLSAIRKWTSRKTRVFFAALFVITLCLPIAYKQLTLRMDVFGGTEDGGRTPLNNAASAILSDHPMGIGANNLIVYANVHGYYERADIEELNRNTFPHNVYWVTAAETGYIGIAALLVFFGRPLVLAFLCGWRNRGDLRGDLLLGFAVSLLVLYIHVYFEWIFLKNYIQYLFAIDVGIIAGLAQQLGYLGSRPNAPTPSGLLKKSSR